jgi:hypothetical protein
VTKLSAPDTQIATTDLLKYYALDASLGLLIVGGVTFWILALLH